MNKKTIGLFIILVVISAIALYYFNKFDSNPSTAKEFNSNSYPSNESVMTGKINGIVDNIFFLEGLVDGKTKIIKFIASKDTKINKKVVYLSADELSSETSFTPNTEDMPGDFSELKKDMGGVLVKTNTDLEKNNNAVATYIDFIVYVYQK